MTVTVQEALDILSNFAAQLPDAALERLGVVVSAIRQEMTAPGSEVQYPIAWDTPRQQSAFFATNGFGKGIPTGRSGRYEEGWVVDEITNGFALFNPSPAAAISGYYQGEQWQSSIHAGRWLHIAVAVKDNIALLPGMLITKITRLWNEAVNK